MSLLQDLQKLGLSDKEAKVYLATLELGQETVQNIAKKAKVNRATTYVILESLSKKGLASQFDHGKKTFFTASNPEALRSLFELQKKEIEERQKYFDALLPEIKTVANTNSDKPVIRFYEGKAGIESAHKDFLVEQKDSEEITRTFFPLDREDEIFTPEDIKRYKTERLQLKIKSLVLYNSNKVELQDSPDGKRIKVSSKEFPFPCDVAIYGDSVRIANLDHNLSAVLIKDRGIAQTFKSLFDLAWEAAEARKKKLGNK